MRIFENKIVHNFVFLSLSQGLNLILPIIIIPYLIKTVGIEKFGLIAIEQAICSYFFTVVDYGFNITAVREISINKNNNSLIKKIIINTINTKLILLLISFPFYIAISHIFLKENFSYLFTLSSFFLVIGQATFPIWLFQGLENMKIITYLNLVSKIFFIFIFFILIKTSSDYYIYNSLLGLSNTVTGLVAIYIYCKKQKITLQSFKDYQLDDFFANIKHGKYLFWSNLSISVYTNSNSLILASFSTPPIVGIYNIAEKLLSLARVLLSVFSQSIYPQLCKIVSKKEEKSLFAFFKKSFVPLIIFIFFICMCLYNFCTEIAMFFSKEHQADLAYIIKYLSFVPFIVGLNVPFYSILLAYNYRKSSSLILIFGALLSILLNILLVPSLSILGTILTVNICEIAMTISLALLCLKIK